MTEVSQKTHPKKTGLKLKCRKVNLNENEPVKKPLKRGDLARKRSILLIDRTDQIICFFEFVD